MINMFAVLAAFAGAFVVLPYFVLPRPKGARSILDVITMNMVRWLAIVIVGIHVLVLLRMFEMLAVVLLCAFGFYFSRLKPSGWTISKGKELAWRSAERFIQRTDDIELSFRVGKKGERSIPKLKLVPGPPEDVPKRSRVRIGLLALIPLSMLGVSFWLRARFALDHMSLSPPDSYHYMAWAKGLLANEIFTDGVYPHGMPALLAFTNKFNASASMLDVTRFIGPLIGTMIVYGIFYTIYRLTDNFGAATFAAGAFGLLGTRPEWHEPWFRQTGPLPQELGLAIVLLALPSAVLAVADREKDHLWTVAAACIAIGFTHPVPLPVFIVLATAGAFGAALVRGGFFQAFKVSAVAVAAGAASMSYMPVAHWVGLDFFEPIKNLTPLASVGEDSSDVVLSAGQIGFQGFSRFALPAVILGLLACLALLLAHEGPKRASKLLGFAAIAIVVMILYDVASLGLDPYYADRLAQVVGPQLALILGLGFAALTLVFPKDRALPAAALMIAGLVALGVFSRNYPAAAGTQETIEYESVTRLTMQIAENYERYSYTIVGTPQQRQVVLGDGWFIEAWVFARDAAFRGARDPGYQMSSRQGISRGTPDVGGLILIPTQEVFIFVEKQPFSGPEVAADGPTEEYYFDPMKRGRIMARMYVWAEMYMRYHTDMSVYFEDEQIKVYRITHSPDVAGAADTPEFKDYTWKPGRLFNTGPTSPAEVDLGF